MDLEWRVDDESEATFFEDEDCMIDSVFEQERCGICIDIVIDRGVLDCCEHWFCFVCIDNWATITNLCPICRKEFQLITCLPVYDTIESIRSEEHSLSGSEDWFIQEKNNTLSFPSYYISEDAVKCLENDGCKIRSGLQATEEDLCIDTSIACDSCDIWYHAYCVGFNSEFTSEKSWLCPRCIANEVPQKSGAVSLQGPGKDSTPESAGWTIEPSLSGKLSVSVADDGETAVVVSMIEEKQKTDCKISVLDRHDSNMEQVITAFSPYSDFLNSETDVHLKDGSCMQISHNDLVFSDYKELYTTASDVDNSSEYYFDISPEIIDFQSVDDLEKATVSSFSQSAAAVKPRDDITEAPTQPSTLQDIPFSLCYSESSGNGEHVSTLEITSDPVPNLSFMTCSTSEGKNEPDKKCSEKTYLGFGDFSSSPADNMVASCDNDMVVDMTHNDKEASDSTEKPKMSQSNIINAGEINDCIRKRELEAVYPVKKLKSDGKSKILPPGSLSCLSSLDGFQVCPSNSRGVSLGRAKQEEAEAPDIMSIVQESDGTSDMPTTEVKAANNSMDKKDNTFGLRVKKIMRRVEKKKESSILAQELGKEIREVVQQKALKDIGKNNDFDEKLLAAFRAAIARSKTELTDKSEVAKKPLHMKGKKRENLTKKIYGMGSGRRRHAWVRDLEIEFWKHRCRKKQPEKVETLQSVLELLKQATNPNLNSSMERVPEEEATDSVLSRVYIADASLFPRKDDIKPLSAFAGISQLDIHNLNKEKSSGIESKEPLIYENNLRKNLIQNSKSSLQLTANSCDSISKKIHAPCFPGEASIQKANSRGAAIKSSGSNFSKGSMPTSKEHDVKSDKKKWALEVLARKNASTNMNANKGQNDNALLKDKYPLLAQLPPEMRPVLASSPHNKVPLSVRRAQLYRITEYYLRRTNLPFIHRTAVTELAVADAVNVEKEISERSNSKLVYVNLCSQAVSQHANKPESAETNVSNSPMAPPKAANKFAEDTNSDPETGNKQESADRIVSNLAKYTSKADSEVAEETTSDPKTGGWSNVEEALKMAGLFSDSPPSSPYRATKDSNEDKAVQENVEEECLNYDAHGNVMDRKQDASICRSPGNEASVYDCINLAVNPPFDFSNSLRQTKEIEPENSKEELRMDDCLSITISERKAFNEPSLKECDRNDKESQMNQTSNEAVEVLKKPLEATEANSSTFGVKEKCVLKDGTVSDTKSCISGSAGGSTPLDEKPAGRDPETHSRVINPVIADYISIEDGSAGGSTPLDETPAGRYPETHSRVINPVISDYIPIEETAKQTNDESELIMSTSKKVEAYIKEHIRPLCKSGVITVEQYRWAVGKTLDKVMKFHHKAKNANFLIREGEKVKKLAEQYVEAAQRKEMR